MKVLVLGLHRRVNVAVDHRRVVVGRRVVGRRVVDRRVVDRRVVVDYRVVGHRVEAHHRVVERRVVDHRVEAHHPVVLVDPTSLLREAHGATKGRATPRSKSDQTLDDLPPHPMHQPTGEALL